MPSPAFYFFLPSYGVIDVWEILVINQIITIIFAGKCFGVAPVDPMFYQPLGKIIGKTCTENSSFRIGNDVNIIVMLFVNIHVVL